MIASAPYYWLTCDLCGVDSTEGSDYTAWMQTRGATLDAVDNGWLVKNGNHLCEDCTPDDRDDQP